MNKEIANSLKGYFETLYEINQKIIWLYGIDVCNIYEDSIKTILEVIQDIPRVFPYCYDNKKKRLELANNSGLIEFEKDIKYLKSEFQDILNNNEIILDKIRVIRNKYEHKMHNIKFDSSMDGTGIIFSFTFVVNKEITTIYALELIKLIKELNIVYSKIQNDLYKYACRYNKQSYAYYERLCKFSFKDFNSIYDDKNLRLISKSLRKF